MSAGGTKRSRGRPPGDAFVLGPARWESETVAKQLDDVLHALEVPQLDMESRRTLQRLMHRQDKYFGGDGRGCVTLLVRTIMESEGNQDALCEPIISAVLSAMRPEWTSLGLRWIEAFDEIPLTATLQTMRSLNIFSERSMASYLSLVIRNKLAQILSPAVLPKPAKPAKAKPKPPKRVREPAQRMAA